MMIILIVGGTHCRIMGYSSTFPFLWNESYVGFEETSQAPFYRIAGFRGWRVLAFLCVLFVSSICLLVFTKDVLFFRGTALLQLVLFCSVPLSTERMDFCPQQGEFELIIESTTSGTTWSLARCELREEDLFG